MERPTGICGPEAFSHFILITFQEISYVCIGEGAVLCYKS